MDTTAVETAIGPATEDTTIERTPWSGTPHDRRRALGALLGAGAVTALHVLAARLIDDGYVPTTLEVVGTVTSLACVWITRRQNVLCMPIGLVSVVAMGTFFFQIDLVGQGWLHLGYYVPVQVVGWRLWIRSGAHRTDKPVAWMTPGARLGVAAAVVVGTVGLALVFERLHGPSDTLLWDASIVAASVAAQALLTIKRIESWWLWLIPVDVSAVALYIVSGAHLFAALYCLYLVLATLGLREWTAAWRAQRQGLTPLQARQA